MSHFYFSKTDDVEKRAAQIKLVLTDVDGVLTDGGVFYGVDGEVFKRFNIRDGMGVERLCDILNISTGIVTGELSGSVKKRAEKLKIEELHLGIKNKLSVVQEILNRRSLDWSHLAYIGDDVNDLEVLLKAGLAVCPKDAMPQIQKISHMTTASKGGRGAFRDLAEYLISVKS